MNNILQKLWAVVRATYPSGSSPYWRALPLGRMKSLLAGTLLLASAIGFAIDLLQTNTSRFTLFWPVLFGVGSTLVLVARIKRTRMLPLIILVLATIGWLGPQRARVSAPPAPESARKRIAFDATGSMIGVFFGVRLLLYFVTNEGLANVRLQTEFSLAHGIQATLVPVVSVQTGSLEIYGRSIPSTEMGGDLIDVIESGGRVLAYVADISGHGLPAGQLMGMLKTAVRVSSQFQNEPKALLESADRVLPDVKSPEMFATLALLRFDGAPQVEYSLAGHLPILHYRKRSHDVVRLFMQQFPLGLLPGSSYASAQVAASPGDLFLMLTDGISETVNEKDEEFGLGRIEKLLTENASKPLPEIWQLVMDEATDHGPQQDDRTLLIARVRETPSPAKNSGILVS